MQPKAPSIVLGAAVYAVAALIVGFFAINASGSAQYLTGVLCCLAAIAGPAVAVWHYTSTHHVTVPAGTGAGLGAAAIVIGGLVSYGITKVLQAVNVYPSDAEMMDRQRDQLIAQGLEPEMVEQSMQMGEMMQGIGGALINLVIAAIIGAIAGAVAASVFKRGPAGDTLDPI
ncbi:hypothetical protein [Rubrivirga sp. IMCC45206]|uniref:hypothetical protein n=1 Tax=Rubrivirga sp. IMCC45206 TaxID=3391614 RepID=UPI0039902243